MAVFTKLKKKDINEILNLYANHSIKSIKELKNGCSNTNYKIQTDRGAYLLKISNDKSEEQMEEELKILDYLGKNNFNQAPLPFKLKTGKKIFKWNNLYGLLYPFIDGKPSKRIPAEIKQIGKLLGSLHKIKVDPSIRDYQEIGHNFKSIKEFAKDKYCPSDYSQFVLEKFHEIFQSDFINISLPKGIIHGDLYYDNTLFNKGHIKAVIDFEQSGVGELIFDLCISISGCCTENKHLNPKLVFSFLEGYQTERPLTEEEKNLFNGFLLLSYLSISQWRIERFYLRSLDEERKYHYRELLECAKNFYAEFMNFSFFKY